MRVLILEDEFHYNRVPRQTIQMKDFVAFGLPDGKFQVVKCRTTGTRDIMNTHKLSEHLSKNL